MTTETNEVNTLSEKIKQGIENDKIITGASCITGIVGTGTACGTTNTAAATCSTLPATACAFGGVGLGIALIMGLTKFGIFCCSDNSKSNLVNITENPDNYGSTKPFNPHNNF